MADIPPHIGEKLYPFSRFIGYRRPEASTEEQRAISGHEELPSSISQNAPKPVYHGLRRLQYYRSRKWAQKLSNMFLSFVGAFFSIALLGTIARSGLWRARNAPVVIGSFGAEAVILYCVPTSPLAQPRAVILGNTLSAIVGVALQKGFKALPGFTLGTIGHANWAAAALAISVSISVMQALNVTHPPGGATAVLAVTIPQIANLSWWYVGDIVACSFVMLAWALLINNVGTRRYPAFWISPELAKKVSGNSGA